MAPEVDALDALDALDGRIAIIGMSGRFPGANDLETFWANLRAGVESIRTYSEAELVAAGESLDHIRDPSYVRAAAPLQDIDRFDAAFFGMSPRDAAVFDPQHRLFLECAWETFERAGYVGESIDGAVGVFASCGLSEYMFKNVLANEHLATSVGEWLIRHTGNDTNFLATRVSYELDLHGPSLNVQTACSSTLVAVHMACQSLLSGECDVALAGGAVVAPIQERGYFYKEGEILSPDGHCRAFDAQAAGTIISSGCGCVLLKPLQHALDDGDDVLAVIRGSAINNDGRAKVGFLAPSVAGQAQVVTEALAVAGVDARDVSYVEAHGTGTLIGDPIEIAGLTQAFRVTTDDTQFCGIGSLKSNIGHTGEASGVGALIKTVLSLQHAELPPSLHYQEPNPQADFANSPFYVNGELRPWDVPAGSTRIAGVTGLGAGGTNAHVVVEEAPAQDRSAPSARDHQLITVSARTVDACARAVADLAAHLRARPDLDLADVAYTRLVGRKAFGVRRTVVASSCVDAADALERLAPISAGSHRLKGEAPTVVFMMPGGGAQYAGMGRELDEREPVFREAIDACAAVVDTPGGFDLRAALFPTAVDGADTFLERPSIALPALFATEYAMARLLASWGIVPAAMIGHSAGEYVAACLSGVVNMEDGLRLVALRGRLFETLPKGAMLSVSLPEADVRALMPDGLSIAAVNAPGLCVASGPEALIVEMEALLAAADVDCTRIHIDVAAHSSMLEPILAEFGAFCRTIRFSAPTTPYVSNLTGTWVTAADVTDPDYWVRHLRGAVRFSDGIATILADPDRVLLEVGPGRTLASLARLNATVPVPVAPTIRHPKEERSDVAFALGAVGAAWEAGITLDAAVLFDGERRRRVRLPTYPFEPSRYWVEPDAATAATRPSPRGPLHKRDDVADWFSTPTWRRTVVGAPRSGSLPASWMIVTDGAPLADAIATRLRARRERVLTVMFGERSARPAGDRAVVDPARIADWTDLVASLRADGELPSHIVHVTAVGPSRGRKRFGLGHDDVLAYEATVERDQASVLFLAQALSGQSGPVHMALVTTGVHALGRELELRPERAMLHGAFRVIPRELGHVTTVAIDVDVPESGSASEGVLVERLVHELLAEPDTDVVAYRRGERWVRSFEPIELPSARHSPWVSGAVYVITGGLGGIGLAVAQHIAKSCHAPTLVLVGRTPMPPESVWGAVSDATDPLIARRIRAIQQIRSLGADVVVATADVTDAPAMTAVADTIYATGRRVTGVIHSAGILHDALIALRTPTASSPVVDVKAKGAIVLEQVFARHHPELFVLFSSVSSIIGLPGQIDYTAANAFLDAYAIRANRSEGTRVIVVNWNAWQEVGMAVDALRAELDKAPVPPEETGPIGAVSLFDSVVDDNDVVSFSTGYSRKRNWLLGEHVVRGADALMPGTGFLEIIRSAAIEGHRPRPVELRDLYFLSPFVVGAGEVRTLKAKFDRAASDIVLYSDVEASPHVTATVATIDVDNDAPRLDLASIRARCARIERFDGYSDQTFMEFGPRWGCLRSVEYGEGEALVTTVVAEEYRPELRSLWLHPAVLDVATGSAQALIPGFAAEMFYVPFSYGRVLVRGPVPAHAVSHVRLRAASAHDLAVFDVTIVDESGTEVIDIEGFTMRRVAVSAALTARRAVDPAEEPAGVETTIEAAMREGILAAEGVDALDRILDAGLCAQVVASSVDVDHWIARVDAEATASDGDVDDPVESGGPQYERPNISSVYAAPATPIERELATLWRELLGVERVGRDDDFFELGGQSLIAVRLFTRMRKRYAVDLPLATLFEAPTIARCAAVVAAKLGVADADGDVDGGDDDGGDVDHGRGRALAMVPPRAESEFRSLVTIQRGGDLTPFFCVHGSGGNVLNFRDLSQAMGRSQPFYGLQARGIDGRCRPHASIEAMATAYLEEVRRVQAEGPYMIGGYSGGGLVAFEMAHQLTADGDDVAVVVLIDTFPPVLPTRHVSLLMRMQRVRDDGLLYVRNIYERRINERRRRREMARAEAAVDRGEIVPSELRELYVEENFVAAASRYVLRPWRGRVVLFRAEELHFAYQSLGDTYGWDAVVEDGFELLRVPGNHDTLVLEPNASTLVRKLRDTIAAAETARSA